jgi:hypothetical protein
MLSPLDPEDHNLGYRLQLRGAAALVRLPLSVLYPLLSLAQRHLHSCHFRLLGCTRTLRRPAQLVLSDRVELSLNDHLWDRLQGIHQQTLAFYPTMVYPTMSYLPRLPHLHYKRSPRNFPTLMSQFAIIRSFLPPLHLTRWHRVGLRDPISFQAGAGVWAPAAMSPTWRAGPRIPATRVGCAPVYTQAVLEVVFVEYLSLSPAFALILPPSCLILAFIFSSHYFSHHDSTSNAPSYVVSQYRGY